MSPQAPFLAPERDPAAKRGRAKGGGTTHYSMPGVSQVSAGSDALTLNTDYYCPLFVDTPLIVDQIAAEVTATAGTNFRIGLYPADTDWQPAAGAAPLADSGNLSSAGTGVKTYTPGTPIFMPRGRYLSVINCDNGPTIRLMSGACAGSLCISTLGSTPNLIQLSVGRTYAAFPTPGTAWTTATNASGAFHNYVWLRVLSP